MIFAFYILSASADAATLNFSPTSGSYQNGDIITVGVYVSSSNQAMNAASGVISFPADKLQVVSLSKSASIMSLWVQEPTYSNSIGAVNFEGIALNPGFSGANGKILSLTFKAKATGAANLNFSSGSILANDGSGTEILKGLGAASFAISQPATGQESPESTTPVEKPGVPLAPKISSTTHPDPQSWYSNKNPKFKWTLPNNVTSARLLYDEKPNSKPSVLYAPAIAEKQLPDIDDGVWYFHAQFKNSHGWGEIAHFRFQIDTKPPEPFEIKIVDDNEISYPRPTILFNTTDAVSGIDHYQLKIGEGEFSILSHDEVKSNPYTLPPQPPGKKTILVKALDMAGNYAVAVNEITIKSIDVPIVTDYPKELLPGEYLTIKGTTYPKIRLSIWLVEKDDEPKRYVTYSEDDGSFTYTFPDKLEAGVYNFWLVAVNNVEASSEPTPKHTVIVKSPAFKNFLTGLTGWISVILPLVALLIVFGLMLWYGWHKFNKLKRKIRKEVREAESALTKAFDILNEHTEKQIMILEKAESARDLTTEENKVIKQLKKDLDIAEGYIRKEIEDIKKKVK